MGLLDFSGFTGDDTVKDEYGLTQADRRQPLFSGLIRGGMLAMAAGENITPGARAQLLGQVGGAYADIPEAMNRVKADAAQMQLRRQQFQANQQKLEQAQKLRAYAQTPEFAELVKDVPPHVKAGLKFAIEAGDADSVQRLLSGIDATAARTRGLEIREADQARKEAEAARKGAEGNPMTPARAQTIIAKAGNLKPDDPYFGTSEYRAAHALLSNPHQVRDANGTLVDMPGQDLHYMPTPTFTMTGEPPKPRTPTIVPGQAPKSLDGKEVEEISKHVSTLQTVDDIDDAITKNPNIKLGNVAAGLARNVAPEAVSAALNAIDPDGIGPRANIANIRSMVIKDRSGASVTLGEMKQLADFLPGPYDDGPTIQKKLVELRKKVNIETKLYYENLKNKNALVPTELGARVRRIGKGGNVIPAEAIAYLEENPSAAKDFDEKYGEGASARVLGR